LGIDGLRLDAIHSIFDPSREHIVAEVSRRVHDVNPNALVIGEIGLDDPERHGAPACNAIWDDHLHHALHTLLTGERDGYYASFGQLEQLADALRQTPSERFVVYAQNHDQVGNRAYGDRLPRHLRPLAAMCTLLSPFIPLLFMGEEYGEAAPFQFFSDHIDEEIATATREGRRREFAEFAQFGEEIPDPQDRATFERSRLTRTPDEAIARLYAELLRLRPELPPLDGVEFDEGARWLRVHRGRMELVCNFGREGLQLGSDSSRVLIATDPQTSLSNGALRLAPVSGALTA
jgi:maltooligosyltrehalose trehalohydrolase